jgi:hypothetical protein
MHEDHLVTTRKYDVGAAGQTPPVKPVPISERVD